MEGSITDGDSVKAAQKLSNPGKKAASRSSAARKRARPEPIDPNMLQSAQEDDFQRPQKKAKSMHRTVSEDQDRSTSPPEASIPELDSEFNMSGSSAFDYGTDDEAEVSGVCP